MATLYHFLAKGGPLMIPLGALSLLTLSCMLERILFWSQLLRGEQALARRILYAAQLDLQEGSGGGVSFDQAQALAKCYGDRPVARFLLAPLQLEYSTPETFRLALEAAGDREFLQMRRGDKLLETVVAVAPLLGLLGTVTGLIVTFFNLKIGGGGGSSVDTSKAALGIAEALITTAGGMVVAIIALLAFRTCTALQAQQMDFFSSVGLDLELLYRQAWTKNSAMPSKSEPSGPEVSRSEVSRSEVSRSESSKPEISNSEIPGTIPPSISESISTNAGSISFVGSVESMGL
jgi:biopolymer transport protein ExbB